MSRLRLSKILKESAKLPEATSSATAAVDYSNLSLDELKNLYNDAIGTSRDTPFHRKLDEMTLDDLLWCYNDLLREDPSSISDFVLGWQNKH